MAGTKVLMSPVSMMMIHNPATIAFGDTAEMQKAINMLAEVKESIMNAYEIKTGMSRTKISHLIDVYKRQGWYSQLTSVDGEYLIKRLQDEVRQSESIRGRKNKSNRR